MRPGQFDLSVHHAKYTTNFALIRLVYHARFSRRFCPSAFSLFFLFIFCHFRIDCCHCTSPLCDNIKVLILSSFMCYCTTYSHKKLIFVCRYFSFCGKTVRNFAKLIADSDFPTPLPTMGRLFKLKNAPLILAR